MTVDRPNTLSGLAEKRAEIAGQIAHTRAMLRQLIIDLDHVDAAIRIFDPSYDVEGIRQKLPTAAHRALRGDLTRATLDALHDAPGPMTTKELARHVMAERGLNTADAALLQLFTRRTGALLRWQRKRGILRSVKDPRMAGSIFGKSRSRRADQHQLRGHPPVEQNASPTVPPRHMIALADQSREKARRPEL